MHRLICLLQYASRCCGPEFQPMPWMICDANHWQLFAGYWGAQLMDFCCSYAQNWFPSWFNWSKYVPHIFCTHIAAHIWAQNLKDVSYFFSKAFIGICIILPRPGSRLSLDHPNLMFGVFACLFMFVSEWKIETKRFGFMAAHYSHALNT